jgi:D-aminopeptidase
MRYTSVVIIAAFLIWASGMVSQGTAQEQKDSHARKRPRELGLSFGILPTGPLNAITDVEGILVGHLTLIQGDNVRTGITAILPHGGNLYLEKVPGAIEVCNGYGKLAGSTQVNELGEIETPILLTNTLSVPQVADGLIEYMLSLPGLEQVRSINPIIGETNDGFLNDIRARPLTAAHVRAAIESAAGGLIPVGSVGAGTSTVCFGFKGGIGTSSRRLPPDLGGWTVGVLVQTNFGGVLTINGVPVGPKLGKFPYKEQLERTEVGSIIIVVATDAPLDHRSLNRLAKRAFLGMARTGGFASNGSGDYCIAFSTHPGCRVKADDQPVADRPALSNNAVSPLFLAAVEATEEAIIDSLFAATPVDGYAGHSVEVLPVEKVLQMLGIAKE